MKYNKLIFIIIISIYLLSHCVYTKIGHLSKEELGWMKPTKDFRNGIFISNLGNESTIFIGDSWKENSLDPFHAPWVSYSPYSIKEAVAGYYFQIVQADTNYKGTFCLRKSPTYDSVLVGTSLGYLSTYSIRPSQYLQTDSFILNDQLIFRDCYIADSTKIMEEYIDRDSLKRRINEWVISKEFGPVYYKFEDGEEYRRVFKPSDSNN